MSDRRIRDLIESALAELAPGAILVGHSGGLDSTVLLHALAESRKARERGLRAVHVDHRLQSDSAMWARHCEAFAIQLGVLTQTANAFERVNEALSWFIGSYTQFAEWRATVDRLTEFAAEINMPGLTFHCLRHTHASQLIDAGVDIVTISRRLGHAKPDVTLRCYSHLFSNDDGKAAAAINAALTR